MQQQNGPLAFRSTERGNISCRAPNLTTPLSIGVRMVGAPCRAHDGAQVGWNQLRHVFPVSSYFFD
jgi:hypothetical protein